MPPHALNPHQETTGKLAMDDRLPKRHRCPGTAVFRLGADTRGQLPIGISRTGPSYRARIRRKTESGFRIFELGTFGTQLEAMIAYDFGLMALGYRPANIPLADYIWTARMTSMAALMSHTCTCLGLRSPAFDPSIGFPLSVH